MSEADWGKHLEYLRSSRFLFFNDDYWEFLVRRVWGIDQSVRLVDFGCGTGYLGLKIMPCLPLESSYTGVDLSERLLMEARTAFATTPYAAEFIQGDVLSMDLEESVFDVAICQTLLLHLVEPKAAIRRMIHCTKPGGRVVCVEPHWNSFSIYVRQLDSKPIASLGLLQRLFENDFRRTGKDGNIGIKLPVYMRELGLKSVGCRRSDSVQYVHPELPMMERRQLHQSILDEGWGEVVADEQKFLRDLVNRGATTEEAQDELERKQRTTDALRSNGLELDTVYAPSLWISFGTKA